MTATIDTEEIRASSSTVEEMRFAGEQESQTAAWDEIILEHYLDQKRRFDLGSRFLRDINRLQKTQGGWWEFAFLPNAIIQLGANKYFVEFKAARGRSITDVWSEVTTRDVFKRNLTTFSYTKFEEESSITSALMERLAEEVCQPSFQEVFTQFLSDRSKKLVAEKRPALRGSPQAVLQAMDASPQPTDEDINDLLRIIKEQEQSATFESFLDEQ